MLYEWRPKEAELPDSVKRFAGQTIAQAFLAERGDTLHEAARGLIAAIASEPCSFYEVIETVPGRAIRLRDVLRERDLDVVERTASRILQRGDILFARAVPFKGCALLVGSGEIVLPPTTKDLLFKIRKSLRDELGGLDSKHLLAFSDELRRVYSRIRRHVVEPPQMKLANTDGDPIEPHTLTYVVPSADAAFEALKPLAVGVSDEDLSSEAVRDAQGRLVKIEFPWLKPGNKMNKGWDNTILGNIRIDGTTLTIDVNSVKRAMRIGKEVIQRLGNQVEEPVVTVKPADELLRAAREKRGSRRRAKTDTESARLYASPEVREALRDLMEKHWDGWIHEKIPALGGKTPLQAVKDPEGREMVEALLIEAERCEERRPAHEPRYDVDRVRIRLGLPARGKVVSIDRLES